MKMKRFLLYLSFLLCCMPLTGYAQDDIEVTDSTSSEWSGGGGGGLNPNLPNGPVTSITLSRTTASLAGGKSVRLVATVNKDAQNKAIQWSTSNSKIATVNEKGSVRGLSKGSATITATAAGNTSLKATCTVTVTSDYEGLFLPDVSFEFCYDVADYNATTHSIPNHEGANLSGASLQLSENIPTLVNGELLRITDRCEAYINRWEKNSTESGSYFYRCDNNSMTIVAKVAPKLNTGNSCDFVTNRGGGYNYMWRIGDNNTSFLHTGRAYEDWRTLPLNSENPQILAVRVDGNNNRILLQNLTTGDSRQIDHIDWGGGDNAFKLFYNDGSEYFRGDFYWVYYSFEFLTDEQLDCFKETVLRGDANGDGKVTVTDIAVVVNEILSIPNGDNFSAEGADANGDGEITVTDIGVIVDMILGNNANAGNTDELEPQ